MYNYLSQLEDNGIGFSVNQSYEGFGLRSMRERVEEVGGKLTVFSEKNVGTRLIAVLPKKILEKVKYEVYENPNCG